MTFILTLAGCALLFFSIRGLTLTMPDRRLASFFPEDVQEKLEPRLRKIDEAPMNLKRICGYVIFILLIAGYAGIFIYAGLDGMKREFTFTSFALRFLTIGLGIKAFDIICLDWFLLTKSHFFQHCFPETEGCEGWRNFGYNRVQQIRQIIMTVAGSLLCAWLCTLL
ncbi:MAG: hypothetical protein IJM63_05520 [Solobacterium sp.]|nr:hypothetical protein [Solobacterium sp.]